MTEIIKPKYIDLVVGGPDFSGTTTQINDDIIPYLQSQGMTVRDLRGTEISALFHAERFRHMNAFYTSFKEFWEDSDAPASLKTEFVFTALELLEGIGEEQGKGDLRVASMAKNNITTYVNPLSADAWVMEEPTKRAAGQHCRVIEQNRSQFGSHLSGKSAVLGHQSYRDDEFLRFKQWIIENALMKLGSRSEESGPYQIFDKDSLHTGVSLEDYYALPGHRTAFKHPPTHLFIVCGPVDWKRDDYLALKAERTGNRAVLDDHESNYSYQLLVNKRYASDWLEQFYHDGCKPHGSTPPKIIRFDIYHSKEVIKREMTIELERILKESGRNVKPFFPF